GPGVAEVMLDYEGRRIPAAFIEASDEEVKRELAAFRLDRALRLGLVPATVAREVRGKKGILQALPARWVSQAEVVAKALRADGWCALPAQFELMYAFDGLIGNPGRTPERVLYDAADWMLFLTGHGRAFGTGKALPSHLQAHPPRPGAEMRRRLLALDAASLARAVGDLLDEGERAALLARRDLLLGGKPPGVSGLK
ncbi:MAG TPA: hypothetical protein VMK66_11840, partial [Myxococcales bacterium]|nr:hypothetical protein [Myxococcales bacterium]